MNWNNNLKKRLAVCKKKAYGTRYSQAVTHLSTNRARHCLTSQIGRDGVYSVWYGRRRLRSSLSVYIPFAFPVSPIWGPGGPYLTLLTCSAWNFILISIYTFIKKLFKCAYFFISVKLSILPLLLLS